MTDAVPTAIADYVCDPARASGEEAVEAARLVFIDAIACALLGLDDPACRAVIEPVTPADVPDAARVPGTAIAAGPVEAAFATGTAVRWLDYNDAWLAREWGHPSDNLGALLSVADHVSRRGRSSGAAPLQVRDVLVAMVQAHEIQGVLALDTSLNAHGFDHVLYVKLASAAVASRLLGGGVDAVRHAVQHAFMDAGPLRVYRHAGNVGPRKSWAAGDATARGVYLAHLALRDTTEYPTVLSRPEWGFSDVILGGQEPVLPQPLGDYVIRNVLLKPAWPSEFHGQTAIEGAIALHPTVCARIDDVVAITIDTHEAAVRIIDKTGPLRNPADRDHCLQYMVAVALIHGDVGTDAYSDAMAADPRIDALRERMRVSEAPAYTSMYHDPARRYQPNAIQVRFSDGTTTDRVQVLAPVGHPERRQEAVPHVERKLARGVEQRYTEQARESVLSTLGEPGALDALAVDEFSELLTSGLAAGTRG